MPLSSLIADTRKAVADDPANAQARVQPPRGHWSGSPRWISGPGAHSFKVDEPPALGGADVAANPVQYALASLGSCQAITYRFWAEQLGIAFDSLTVRVEGDLDIRGFFGFDDSVRPGFSAVRVEVTVTGPESPGALPGAGRRGRCSTAPFSTCSPTRCRSPGRWLADRRLCPSSRSGFSNHDGLADTITHTAVTMLSSFLTATTGPAPVPSTDQPPAAGWCAVPARRRRPAPAR